MAVLLSTPEREAFSASLGFAPFLTDQTDAQRRFVDGIIQAFRDVVPVAPDDFSFSVSPERGPASLSDFRCTFRFLGKRQVITLGSDSLAISLDDLTPLSFSLATGLLGRLHGVLASNFKDHEVHRAAVSHQRHVETVDRGAASDFLSAFSVSQAFEMMGAPPLASVQYRPGLRAVFSGEHWELRRTVEISELLPDALFIGTDLTLADTAVSSFLSRTDLIETLFERVDRATDLEYRSTS